MVEDKQGEEEDHPVNLLVVEEAATIEKVDEAIMAEDQTKADQADHADQAVEATIDHPITPILNSTQGIG